MTASEGFVINFNASDVSPAGDVNGDGYDDIIVSFTQTFASGVAYVIYGGNFASTGDAVNMKGTSAAEVLPGGGKADTLHGGGGADIFRSGAGNDLITIGDGSVRQIHAGSGLDTVAFEGSNVTFDTRDHGGGQMTGIERFDLTGTGNNQLTLDAADLFHFSSRGNMTFTAAANVNNAVIDGNAGDSLSLTNDTVLDASWELNSSDVKLDGTTGGHYDIYNLVKDGNAAILASVAVDADISVL
jgi:hypothetical protein